MIEQSNEPKAPAGTMSAANEMGEALDGGTAHHIREALWAQL